MNQFTVLYTACTDDLPEEESLALYQDVTTMDDSRECQIDTSLVVSRAVAKQQKIKPTCEADAFPGACLQLMHAFTLCSVCYRPVFHKVVLNHRGPL